MTARNKLSYFDLRGRAEPIRLMLHARGDDFDDHRVVSRDDWAELKRRAPFGALPLWDTPDISLPESHAIFRHLARVFGWTGDELARDAQLELDVAQEALAEAQENLWRFAWVESDHEKMETYAGKTLDPRLTKLEAWFGRGGRREKYWVGDSMTHVDFIAFCYLDELDAFFPDVLRRFELLSAFRRGIESLPGVEKYLASGNRPMVFGMGIRGPKIDRRRPILKGATLDTPWTDPIALS